MTPRARMIAVMGALSASGLAGCDKREAQATEVPGGAAAAGAKQGECLHSEGCCGGHTEGDASCGAATSGTSDGPGATPAQAADGVQRFEWVVEPGAFAEVNVELGDGARMTATFTADATVAWNVHSHPGKTPTIHAEGRAAAGTQAHAADEPGLFSYLWLNDGKQPVALKVELRIEGTGRVHSTHP